MKTHVWTTLLAMAVALWLIQDAVAEILVVPGQTASIGNGFTDRIHPEGSHFHTSNLDPTDLPSGNPPLIPAPGVAEVGGFFGDEEVRAVSEFSIVGLSSASQVTLLFDVFDVSSLGASPDPIDGLFGQGPLSGFVDVFAFAGNGVEEVEDYSAESITEAPIFSFEADSLEAGKTLQVDISDLFNSFISDEDLNPGMAATALGVRLQTRVGLPDSVDQGAVTFHNFRLEIVPEPVGGSMIVAGLLGLSLCRRRR